MGCIWQNVHQFWTNLRKRRQKVRKKSLYKAERYLTDKALPRLKWKVLMPRLRIQRGAIFFFAKDLDCHVEERRICTFTKKESDGHYWDDRERLVSCRMKVEIPVANVIEKILTKMITRNSTRTMYACALWRDTPLPLWLGVRIRNTIYHSTMVSPRMIDFWMSSWIYFHLGNQRER